ncbi:uncharacterized protein Aud_007943 [Aspergillus udagawae]|uniref:Uncharacterized protein n=1 Tax=Aspergillus udagawae TaxID=91492 RepID=A0A8E0V449_9EURO|nr:uncharacterized protein Aud_007943 [Aspergillus udagawae]GIC91499.1 hypothetical protein Aud_007943 [Aspergillus udagawae]
MKLQLNPTALLLSTLTLTSQLARADLSYYCELAKDGSKMIQKAYCCDDLAPARYAPDFLQGKQCTLADAKTVGDSCPHDKMMPVCCYTIVDLYTCTSNGYFQDL